MSTTFKGPVVSTNGFTGAVTGNITGNITGDVTGNVTGNVTGDVTGDLTGAVVGTTVSASTSATIGTGGTALTLVKKSTIEVVIPTTAAAATGDVTVTVTGATAGDLVLVTPLDAAMETDLAIVGAWVASTNNVKIRFLNNDGSNAFTGSTTNFQIALLRS